MSDIFLEVLDLRAAKAKKKKAAKVAKLEKKRMARERRKQARLHAYTKAKSGPVTVIHYPQSKAFLSSYEWRKLRMEVLKKFGARCQCCGATAKDGAKICVDHIKPRSRFPELALEFSNLQVLCDDCNHGKGSWDQTDWRPPEMGEDPPWTEIANKN